MGLAWKEGMEVREGRSEQRPGRGSTGPPGDCVELRGVGEVSEVPIPKA